MVVRGTTEAGRCVRELELDACMACGQVCEITGAFHMPSPSGSESYVRTRCVDGHVLVGPAFALRSSVG